MEKMTPLQGQAQLDVTTTRLSADAELREVFSDAALATRRIRWDYCVSRGVPRHDADGVVADGESHCWERLHHGCKAKGIRSLLFCTTVNAVADFRNEQQRRGPVLPLLGDRPGREADPAEAAALRDALNRLVESLEPEELGVFRWALRGCSNKEIADALDFSTRTCTRRRQEIVKKWAKALGYRPGGSCGGGPPKRR